MEIHNRIAVVLGGPRGPVQSPLGDSDTAAWLQENSFPAVILVSSSRITTSHTTCIITGL